MEQFSIAAMVRAFASESWRKLGSYERVTCDRLNDLHGVPSDGYSRIPVDALLARDLVSSTAGAGGYLTSPQTVGYIDALQPAAVVASLCTPVTAGQHGVIVPRGISSVTTYWLSSESAAITESQPAFGAAAAVPKLVGAYTEVSRQLLLQSNVEDVLRREMRNAAAAALDTAILQGSGAAGQPVGLLSTAGCGAFTGASLNQAAARNAQADVLAASAVVNRATLAYVTTPSVAETLSTRQRFTDASTALWEGSLAEGSVEGDRARATTACPTATMFYGDWSAIWIAQWEGGLQIQIDPFTKFRDGLVGIRLLLPVDIIVTRAPSFSIATLVS